MNRSDRDLHRKHHSSGHAFGMLHPADREGLVLGTRRNFLKASFAGLGSLSLPALLQARASASEGGFAAPRERSVILLWMAGGPSHIDTWDPKPDRPAENRGSFATIPTRLPGVRICEHLPKMAAMLDRFTVIRSMDATGSNHEPNTVFQTGNVAAESRTNPEARKYPAIGSLCAKLGKPGPEGIPPYVAFRRSPTHLAFGGYLGKQYDPFIANDAARLPIYTEVGKDTGGFTRADAFTLPSGVTVDRLRRRQSLRECVDQVRAGVDVSGEMDALGHYEQQAVEMILGGRARQAFNLEAEPPKVRERYGPHLWMQQALLARRLVEAGVGFVTVDLSYHPASGTWDTHGDDIPPYGGIESGLKPLLPLFDHLITTLVSDLEERGLLEHTLVLAMGEFGRSPILSKADGRNHWPDVMSMALTGGKFRHGQVIGASTPDGGYIEERPVTPGDLAATIYHHMGVPLDATYQDFSGRPRAIVENGAPLKELI